MKRTERRHLKQNELVTTVSRARELYALYHRQISSAGLALVLLLGAVAAVGAWQQHNRRTSTRMLAEVLERYHAVGPTSTPAGPIPDRALLEQSLPRFTQIAQSYRSQPAGLTARYYEGITLVALGRTDEARKALDDVVARDRESLVGALARLALADLDMQQGHATKAVDEYKQLATDAKSSLPEDALLLRLGRAYQQAGDPANAERTFTRLVDAFPSSPYLSDAQHELSGLKPGTPAPTPRP